MEKTIYKTKIIAGVDSDTLIKKIKLKNKSRTDILGYQYELFGKQYRLRNDAVGKINSIGLKEIYPSIRNRETIIGIEIEIIEDSKYSEGNTSKGYGSREFLQELKKVNKTLMENGHYRKAKIYVMLCNYSN
jgi:hypothetical protein